MTRDQFYQRFRGRMLLFLTEAWTARHEGTTQLGQLMDRHALELRRLLEEMYETLYPTEKHDADRRPTPATNGAAAPTGAASGPTSGVGSTRGGRGSQGAQADGRGTEKDQRRPSAPG